MLEEANLTHHLQLVRDYYALGRGELFQHFILATENHLRGDVGIQSLNSTFNETARKIYTDNDKTYIKFELCRVTDDKAGKFKFSTFFYH